MSKFTTRYLTANSRLVFFKLLDDFRNERLVLNRSELGIEYLICLELLLLGGKESLLILTWKMITWGGRDSLWTLP